MITKDEMEKVWQSGPVGWLKSASKKSKGKNPYRLTVKFWEKTYLNIPEISKTIWAKTLKEAENQARFEIPADIYKTFPNTVDRPRYEIKITPLNT